MPESKRLPEAEATRALDRDDESGTRLVVPDEARLANDRIPAHLGQCDSVTCLKCGRGLVDEATEKAYPMGFDAGSKSRDGEVAQANSFYEASDEEARVAVAKVAELQEQLKARLELLHKTAIQEGARTKERDAALEQVRTLEKETNNGNSRS